VPREQIDIDPPARASAAQAGWKQAGAWGRHIRRSGSRAVAAGNPRPRPRAPRLASAAWPCG